MSKETTDHLRISALRISNFMRLTHVELKFDEEKKLVVISGKNGAGKSSLLRALECALGGKKFDPPEPIRHGKDSATVEVEIFDKYLIKVVWKGPGARDLIITEPTGRSKFSSPQALLNEFYNDLTFHPMAFMDCSEKEQCDILKKLVGIDFDSLESDRQELYDKRTDENREIKRLTGYVATFNEADLAGVPDAELDEATLGAQIKDANAKQKVIDDHAKLLKEKREAHDKMQGDIAEAEKKIALAKKMLDALGDEFNALADKALPEVPDVESLTAQFQNIQSINAKVAKKKEYLVAKQSITLAQARADKLTVEIEQIDADKQEAIAGADLPIEGLIFKNDLVVFKDVPLKQCASSVQLRASVAIACALNPKLRIMLVREGSLLDSEGLKLLGELAQERDMFVLVERVTDGEAVGICIEDGEVKE